MDSKENIIDKLIFLDVDGVLNSDEFARWCHEHPEFKKNGGYHQISPTLVGRVIKICEATGAKIVLSSSWRLWNFEQTVKNLSSKRDLRPILDNMVGITQRTEDRWRGQEIKYFLNDCRKNHFNSVTEGWNPLIRPTERITNFPKFVIIDDDADMLEEQLPFFIQTDFITGITDEDVEKAIKILNE